MRRMVMMNNNSKEFLYDMLEKILFDENQLTKLKDGIEEVSTGRLSPKLLRKRIIELRVEIVEKLLEFFPFYFKQITTNQKINEFTEKKITSAPLSEELQEKNELLEKVGTKINSIYEKLKEHFNV